MTSPQNSGAGSEDSAQDLANLANAQARAVPGTDLGDTDARDTDLRTPIFLMIDSLQTGGSERQFAELARSLDPIAFDVNLGCLQKGGPFAQDLGEMHEFPLGGNLYGLRSIGARLRLARHLRRCRIAIAHAFDFYSNMTLIPSARLARIPVVLGSQRQMGDLLTRAQSRAQAAMFRWCDAVVCNSRAAAGRLIEQGLPERRVVVIGNALAPEAFENTAPALPRRPGLLRVGMIARMNARYKNHHAFLRAAARLHGEFPDVEFLLVGDGPLRSELEQDAEKLGLRGRVQFLGDRRDIPALFASMDLSVVPSASESLSNVALESMAAGVPVVATRVGGNPELISEQRGVLVAPDDEDALVSALKCLLKDAAQRTDFGRNARQFAKQNFSRQMVLDQYQQLYTELLARKGWRPSRRASSRPGSSKRLRVALVAPTLRFVGGQAVQADLFLRHWKHDADVDARFIAVDPDFPAGLRWAERVPFLRTVIREPIYAVSLWRNLKGVDAAHIFSASYWSFLLAPTVAWLVARLRGTKSLINYRSGEARDHLKRFRSARSVLKGADRLVVPSAYLVDVFREFGLQAQVVPNIVDLEQFTFRARTPLRPHLICTRGFHPYYCIDIVVRAFAEVQRAFPEARLDLVGKGPLETHIRSLVDELQLSGVNFAGVASRQEIGRCYDQADIFINASRVDNMPVSVIEAFGAGTPVVTTAPESMRYLVEHERTGLLSEPGDAAALAQNVIRLLTDPELADRLARNAYEESRRYRWTAVREQWLQIYQSMANPKLTSPADLARMEPTSGVVTNPNSAPVPRQRN
ncbi:MAG: glycosyltransferase [Candidatus Sulfotelmatobacter sp.]